MRYGQPGLQATKTELAMNLGVASFFMLGKRKGIGKQGSETTVRGTQILDFSEPGPQRGSTMKTKINYAATAMAALAATCFNVAPATAQESLTDEQAALGAKPLCAEAASAMLAKMVADLVGPTSDCGVAFDYFDKAVGGGAVVKAGPYPFDVTVDLYWDQITYEEVTSRQDDTRFQSEVTLVAAPGTALSGEWFAANRRAIFPTITDWSAFDAATPNEEGVIEFQFPDGETYRGPFIDRAADGSIILIDFVGGNY